MSLVAVLLLLTCMYEDAILFKRAKTIKIQNVDFKGPAQEPRSASAKVFPQADDNFTFKAVDIHLKMKVHSITDFNNVFQTAPANRGIRLELSKPSTLALVVGHTGPEVLKGFVLTRSLELDKWYSVDITVTRDKRLRVSLGDKIVVDSLEKDIYFTVSDIAVGTGFSGTRPFDGIIDNFSMTARFFTKSYDMERMLLTLRIILISGLVVLILLSLPIPQAGLKPSLTIGVAGVIILIGFASAVFYHYSQGVYLGREYPFDTFLSNTESARPPFYYFVTSMSSIDGGALTPPSGFFLGPLFPKGFAFIIFTLLPVIGFVGYNYRKAMASLPKETGKPELFTHVLIFSLLTYPFLLALDRGSPELLVFLLLALFAHFFALKKFRSSACFLAVAAAFKIYPLVFLALFIVHKKHKQALLSGFLAVLITGVSFLFAGQSFDRWPSVSAFTDPSMWIDVSPRSVLQFNSSLFGALHFLSVSLFQLWSTNQLLITYLCVTPILFLLLIYYLVKPEAEPWTQFLFLFIATLLLMPVSPDDRLLLLLIPFWYFAQSRNPLTSDVFYAVSIAALLIPDHYLVAYQGTDQAGFFFASISVVLNPLIMVTILSKGVSETLKARTTPPNLPLNDRRLHG